MRSKLKCEICHKNNVTVDDTVCKACDKQMLLEQVDFLEAAPLRQCRICEAHLPRHRYFNCDDCDPSDSESEFDGFDDMNVDTRGGARL